ncbi:MAG: hypothetical protein AAF490_12995, partial [Chloroflexota bacterium]
STTTRRKSVASCKPIYSATSSTATLRPEPTKKQMARRTSRLQSPLPVHRLQTPLLIRSEQGLRMGEMARFRTSSSIQDGVRAIPPLRTSTFSPLTQLFIAPARR